MEPLSTSEAPENAIGEGDGDGDRRIEDLPLAEQVAVLRREWRELQVEWLSMYDQFRSLYGRIARRQQREEVVERSQPAPLNPAALALLGIRHPPTNGDAS